ncbi:putative 2OG-Fe(II) oxygenase [Luteimonas deserti]|uniref:Tetratricopeptide repeat protein n=1 Tax=Luteimonas deserti TaxID=2752306 RepID=A0A7Z0QSK3_9GAMM|nr:tetratricopeptide repeat protein [Luteimonas deserti]NYZ63062.1 tetratricopeptide repeat protein [Luteimonas deserti]
MSVPEPGAELTRRLQTALAHLRDGRLRDAVVEARTSAQAAPFSAEAQQVLGRVLAAAGDADGAERAYRAALALVPGHQTWTLEFAAWLAQNGRLETARDVLAAAPATGPVVTQLGLVSLQLGDTARACNAFERATVLQPASAVAWHGLGNALRASDRLDEASAAFRRATACAPESAGAWINLGVCLRLTGRTRDALECLYRARELGYKGPELHDVINGVLDDSGETDAALIGALDLARAEPEFVQGQETLTQLLLEQGAGASAGVDDDPFATFRDAVDRHPGNVHLRIRFLRMLLGAGRADEVLERIGRSAGHPGSDPVLSWFAGEALGLRGEHAQAEICFAEAHRALCDSPEFLNAYARHALKSGRFDQAGDCAAHALQRDPLNQEAWTHMGTVWRLFDDPRETWLNDYERLVGFVQVDTPPGFSTQSEFLAALGEVLERMHAISRQRVHQSVRNGSQTAGQLFGGDDEVLRATQLALSTTIRRWLASLPQDPRHPFLARRRADIRYKGSWSVRLRASGSHTNHIHDQGWLSSAFYVALPPSVDASPDVGAHAGWIQFGQPARELGLDLPPRRVLQPRQGWLALFPSYVWHGTVPFDDPEARLTIAFDVQPA